LPVSPAHSALPVPAVIGSGGMKLVRRATGKGHGHARQLLVV
jgi:hypothetical protein